jgi:energy-coupling factor transporter ATP-binding protein EcfA2
MNVIEQSRNEWLAGFRTRWRQGEHIALIGPTGSGKTGLASDLLAIRAYVVAFAVKAHDDTLGMFKGYKIIKSWPPEYGQHHVILWVKPKSLQEVLEQRTRIIDAMESIYKAGGWCAYFDDLSYIADTLRVKMPIVVFLNQGRSSHISAVCATTRPRKVPTEAFNQCRHVIAYQFDDSEEVRRIAEIAGLDYKTMLQLNGELHTYPPKGYSDFIARSRGGDIVIVRNG